MIHPSDALIYFSIPFIFPRRRRRVRTPRRMTAVTGPSSTAASTASAPSPTRPRRPDVARETSTSAARADVPTSSPHDDDVAVPSAAPVPAERGSSRARARHSVIFFDCDDCLYKNDWRTANALTAKIESITTRELGLDGGAAYALYKKYGTCLRGLMEEKILRSAREVDDFLIRAHDVPLEIERDEALRGMLERIETPKWVFTASAAAHARRCLAALGIDDLFEGIIDVRAVGFETKHSPKAYEAAMRIAGVEDPAACLFLDDSVSNMRAARAMGWTNVLVGTHARDGGELIVCEHADHIIRTVHDFEALMPEHFRDGGVEDAVGGRRRAVEDAVPKAS